MRIVMAAAALGIALAGCAMPPPIQMTPARAAAIHECSVKAAKYSYTTWQTTQFATYGTCMADHGQRLP
jgi:hypothetical protein